MVGARTEPAVRTERGKGTHTGAVPSSLEIRQMERDFRYQIRIPPSEPAQTLAASPALLSLASKAPRRLSVNLSDWAANSFALPKGLVILFFTTSLLHFSLCAPSFCFPWSKLLHASSNDLLLLFLSLKHAPCPLSCQFALAVVRGKGVHESHRGTRPGGHCANQISLSPLHQPNG